MTLPFSRRSRERRAAIAGDFPETGESIADILKRLALDDTEIHGHIHHDDDTRPFAGASGGAMPPAEAHREAGLRHAVTLTDPDTQPLGMLRARPAAPHAPAAPRPQDTGPMPKLSKYAARPRPQRVADAAIFLWSDLLGQFIMLCGVCPPSAAPGTPTRSPGTCRSRSTPSASPPGRAGGASTRSTGGAAPPAR